MKRKQGADDKKPSEEAQPPQASKRKKRSEAFEDSALDLKLHVNRNIAMMDGRLLADYVAQRTRRFTSDLSLIELGDQYLPGI